MICAALQHLLAETSIIWQLHALVFHHVPETSSLAQDFSYLRMTGDTEPQFPAISEFLMENPKLLKFLTEILKCGGYNSIHLSFCVSACNL